MVVDQVACCVDSVSLVVLCLARGLVLDQDDLLGVRVLGELANDVPYVDFLSLVGKQLRELALAAQLVF